MIYTNIQSVTRKSAMAFTVLLVAFLFTGFAQTAFAVGSPDGCTADNSVVNIAKSTVTAEPGETITFHVDAGNPVSGDGCDITNRTLTLTLPDGSTSQFGPFDYLNGDAVAFVGSDDYVADTADVVAGKWTATVEWDGTQEDGLGSVSTGQKQSSVVLIPVNLEVTKTATPAAEETYGWEITKSVSPETWDLFVGDSGTSEYTIDLAKSLVGTTYSLSGTISIHNPAEFATAHVTDVTDVVDGVGAVTVDCPDGLSFDIAPGDTVECTYSTDLLDATSGDNTATVTTDGDVGGGEDIVAFDPSQATPEVVGGDVNVDDTFDEGDAGPFSDSDSYTYTRAFTCGSGDGEFEGTGNTVDNTATIVETEDFDDASVAINCYDLAVEKTASGTFDEAWDWQIEKSADQSELNLNEGETTAVSYTVEVSPTSDDVNHMVEGTITITNNHPTLAADIASVIDELDAANIPVDCSGATSVAAASSLECSYGPTSVEGATLNEVTVTQQNYDYDSDNLPSAGGSTDYTDDAVVNYIASGILIDDCVDVDDDNVGVLGTVCADDVDKTFDYDLNFGTDEENDVVLVCDENSHPNIASFETTDDDNDTDEAGEDDFTVTANVTCAVPLVVTKTVETDYDLTWNWDIVKTADTENIAIENGETTSVGYTVELSALSEEANHMVTGVITIENPEGNPDAEIVSVDDVLDVAGAANVTCDEALPYVLAGGDTLECTYEVASDGTDSENVVTVETSEGLVLGDDDTQSVVWGDASNEIDECVTVNDTIAGDLGEVCADDEDKTLEYEVSFGTEGDVDVTLECGSSETPNTATLTTNDTETQDSDDALVAAEVECAVFAGCTPGYWKNNWWSENGGASPMYSDLFDSVFGTDVTISWSEKGKPGDVEDPTMLQALAAKGGGINALVRHAAAALLNATFLADMTDTEYPLDVAGVIELLNDAVDSGDYNEAHQTFADFNEIGCSLNAHGDAN